MSGPCATYRSASGFTLVELMIVVVIIGILAAIAYPAYFRYVVRANRVEAQTELVKAQQMLERHYTAFGSYADAVFDDSDDAGNHKIRDESLSHGSLVIYRFSAEQLTDNFFLIRATPDADGPNRDDGYVEIDSVGAKRWVRESGKTSEKEAEEGWEK